MSVQEPQIDKVTAVIARTNTIQARFHKGNAAAIHHLFVEKDGLSQLLTNWSSTKKDSLRELLAHRQIFLTEEQLDRIVEQANPAKPNPMQPFDADELFKALLEVQKEEIKAYIAIQPKESDGSPQKTTPGYYYQLLTWLDSKQLQDAGDYESGLKAFSTIKAKPGEKQENQPKGQLMLLMNREYQLYAELVDPQIDYGTKAENLRHQYFKEFLAKLPDNSGKSTYDYMQTYVKQNEGKFPGGFHVKVDNLYEKKGHAGYVQDPRPAGKGHHISLVNLGMSNDELIDAINNRDVHCPVHDVTFMIGATTYGLYLKAGEPGKPMLFYKAPIDSQGKFILKQGKPDISELKASESQNVKADGTGTKLLGNKYDKLSSVTHAIAESIKELKANSLGLNHIPYVTADPNPVPPPPTPGTNPLPGFKVKSGGGGPPPNPNPDPNSDPHALTIGAGNGAADIHIDVEEEEEKQLQASIQSLYNNKGPTQ